MRGASVTERAPAALAGEAINEKGNHLASEYLYTQLRRYIFVVFRPTDRLVEISDEQLTQSLSLQTDRTSFGCGSFRGTYPCDVTQQLSEFKPDYVLSTVACIMSESAGITRRAARGFACSSRIILVYYSTLWKPLLRLATALRLRRKTPEENWIANEDIWNFLLLAVRTLRHESKLLSIYIPLVSTW